MCAEGVTAAYMDECVHTGGAGAGGLTQVPCSCRISVYVHAPSCREGWKPGVHVSSGALVQVLTGVHGSHVCCVRQSGLFP